MAPAGLSASSRASITSSVFSDANFLTFGRRLLFLLSFILVLTGLWIRNRVDETPSFKKVKSEHLAVKVPVVETLKHHWRAVLITIGAKFVETSTFFIFATLNSPENQESCAGSARRSARRSTGS